MTMGCQYSWLWAVNTHDYGLSILMTMGCQYSWLWAVNTHDYGLSIGNQYLVNVEVYINNCNVMSFFRFVSKRTIYPLVIISLAHALVHVTDFPVIKVHADELSKTQNTFWLPRIISILICLGVQKRQYTLIGRRLFIFTFAEYVAHNLCCQIRAQPMLKLKTYSGFHDLFLKYVQWIQYIWWYIETCLNWTSLGPTFVFGIDRSLVYTD
jgi:hypothetical protein